MKKKWKHITTDRHAYMWECTTCGHCIAWVIRGTPNDRPYICPKCKEGKKC